MLTFDGVWHFWEVFSSQMNPGFLCTGQIADSVYGIVWVSGCWCQSCGLSGPWWWWGYGMGRRMLWAINTGAFYWWHFECTEIRDEILRPIVVPFIHDHHLMLLHDNARPHVARICAQFLEAENIPVLAWPAYSLDMSPIERVWDALDRRIRQRVPVPANIQQLHTAIEEEWTNIPQATINNQIYSMWRRCVALREANGSHTRYWVVSDTDRTPPIQ